MKFTKLTKKLVITSMLTATTLIITGGLTQMVQADTINSYPA